MLLTKIVDTPIVNLFIAFLEIAIISFVIDYFLASIWNTKTTEALVFVMGSFIVLILSQLIGMFALAGVASCIMSLSATVLPILFQQELKLALSRFGSGNKLPEVEIGIEEFIEKLSLCVYKMSSKRIGALIVIEKSDSLEPFIQHAIIINAKFSNELVQTIFSHGTPLHDGAIIISGTTIVAASAILPLSDEAQLSSSRTLGTRHRAAIGISQQTDSFVIVTSEESGKVSIAQNGLLTFGIKHEKFRANLKKALLDI